MNYVFFDLDETLIETLQTNKEIFKSIRRAIGIKMSDVKFLGVFRTILRKNMLRYMQFDLNESVGIDPIDFYFEDAGYEHGDLQGFKDANFKELQEALGVEIDREALESAAHDGANLYTETKPGIVEAVSYIRNYAHVGIITNGTHTAQWKKVEAAGLKDKFDDIFVSGDFGLGKPDPKFYNHIIKATNCDVSHSFMVGDNIQSDYFGSLAVGLNPIFFSKHKVVYDITRATNAEEILKIVTPVIFSNI